jgi:hypothetical protein
MSTFTRLPLALGEWQTNFIALPSDFAKVIQASADFGSQGVVCFRLNWSALGATKGETISKECYVGWSGLISRGPFVQVPSTLAENCGIIDPTDRTRGVLINVYAVRNCKIGARVDLEPESVADWEILEKHAFFVEQVSAEPML